MVSSVCRSVLVTGVYGSGKSAVICEIADMLEAHAVHYGALDLDWLWWFNGAGDYEESASRLLLQNLESVASNYVAAGVDHFVMALAIERRELAEAIAATLPGTLRVVRLETPLDVIARRLDHDAGSGRKEDLKRAGRWIEHSIGVGVEDVVVSNDRELRDTAAEILDWLGWLG